MVSVKALLRGSRKKGVRKEIRDYSLQERGETKEAGVSNNSAGTARDGCKNCGKTISLAIGGNGEEPLWTVTNGR